MSFQLLCLALYGLSVRGPCLSSRKFFLFISIPLFLVIPFYVVVLLTLCLLTFLSFFLFTFLLYFLEFPWQWYTKTYTVAVNFSAYLKIHICINYTYRSLYSAVYFNIIDIFWNVYVCNINFIHLYFVISNLWAHLSCFSGMFPEFSAVNYFLLATWLSLAFVDFFWPDKVSQFTSTDPKIISSSCEYFIILL